MSVIVTHAGIEFPLDRPGPEHIDIGDIATALSRAPRFAGHTATRRAYSVAEHSVLVAALCPPADALWGLLHDAAEAYTGDITTPLKNMLAGAREIEGRIARAVAEKFALPWPMPAAVKRADAQALAWEMRDLMAPQTARHVRTADLPDRARAIKLGPPIGENAARAAFLAHFARLQRKAA
jgi:5'-deoxynucleotidase YfbR-like HD superfamily hydrolase